MNKLSLLVVSLSIASAARAAGPQISEPGAPQVKLELAAPQAAALPSAAASLPETASPQAGELAAPISAVPGAAAAAQAQPAAAAQTPEAGVESQQAALDHQFDGSVAKADDDDSISPEIDFGAGVSQAHRDLFKEAIAAHGDSLAGFFDLTGQPRPGFLYVSAARDDSPGAATVVSRVIYRVSAHSSRFDERVDAPFWIGVDLRSKKIEFFTKDPAAAASAPESELHRRVADAFAALDVNSFAGLTWSADEPADYVEMPLLRENFGDGYSYVALVPRGAAPDHFVLRRQGGLAGMTVYSSPVALTSAQPKTAVAPANGDDPRITVATKALVRAEFEKRDRAGWPGVTWRKFPQAVTKYARLHLSGSTFGDGYEYTALIAVWRAWMNGEADPNRATQFMVERRGGQTGGVVYAGPFRFRQKPGSVITPATSIPVPDMREGVLVSPQTAASVKGRFIQMMGAGFVDSLTWGAAAPQLGEHATLALTKHRSGTADEYNYVALIPAGQDSVFYLHRTGGFAGGSVYAGPFATDPSAVKERLKTALREEDAALERRITTGIGAETVVVRAQSQEDLAAAKAVVARRLPDLSGLFTFQVATGRIVAQAEGQSKTPPSGIPDSYWPLTFNDGQIDGQQVWVKYNGKDGAMVSLISSEAREVSLVFLEPKSTRWSWPFAVDGSQAFALRSLLGHVLGAPISAPQRAAVVELRARLQAIFTGAQK